MYQVVNPATGELVESFPTATDEQISTAIARAHQTYLVWRDKPVSERAAVLARAGELFDQRSDQLAEIVATEMGKRFIEGKGELQIVSSIFAYYAEHAAELVADEPLPVQSGGEAIIRKSPIGALLGIMPWNFPYYQVARFAAPNLALGNTILLKHAPICPKSSQAIETLLADAGLPDGAYTNLYATNDQAATIIADPRVQGVSLTGSERAGAAVGAEAGKALKKAVLELGGSDPMIILDTDDLPTMIKTAVMSRMGNAGQACNAPKRMIVLSELYDDFVAGLTEAMGSFAPGDPMDPETTLAPLSSEQAARHLAEQLETAVRQGATVRVGGRRIDRPGAFVEATVLTDLSPQMDAWTEELFGPVAIVLRAESEEEAVRLANDTPFGLGSSVFSADHDRARRVGEQIDAGMVYVNSPEGSEADLPFGGVKRSGVGRELGPLGIEEFMNKKIIRL